MGIVREITAGNSTSARLKSATAAKLVYPGRVAPRLAYVVQDSVQTLGDALEEYYQANPDRVVRPESLSEESRALFRNHDICHVIFGLDTRFEDEAMADMRTLFSTNVGWARYFGYLWSDKTTRALFEHVGYGSIALATLRAAPRIVRAFFQSLSTLRRWPWDAPDRFMIRSLKHLRREFKIKVI